VNPSETLSAGDQALLLQLARNAVHTTVQKGRKLPAVESLSPPLREKRGVFVTLWMEGELRGCIGFPYPTKPLAAAVQEAAVAAALYDPRFPAVRAEELSLLEVESSVLTEPRPISPRQVEVGVHGLIVRKGGKSGLLLPQVAVEYRWDREEFLSQTCVKAGLEPGAWKAGTEIFGFEAQVFSEGDLEKRRRKNSL